jgi:hypothetical protein
MVRKNALLISLASFEENGVELARRDADPAQAHSGLL